MRITIVEDEDTDAELLGRLIREYADRSGRAAAVDRYTDPQAFFDSRSDAPDVLFLDICMPGINGMEAARRIRENNSRLIIVFVTNMVQYAVDGYSVQATDFIVKPASAASVNRVMDRVCAIMDADSEKKISVKDSVSGKVSMLSVGDIYYVEVSLHRLTWHTKSGNIADWGTLDAVRGKLPAKVFSRCHVLYLVNLAYVKEMKKDSVVVAGETIPVSRSQKKNFCADLAKYLGEGR